MNDIGTRVNRLRGFLLEDPGNVALLAELADLLIEDGNAKHALQYIDSALRIAPDSEAFAYRKAVALKRLGDREAARASLEQLAATRNCPPAVRYELADLLFSERNFDGCIARLTELSDQERHGIAAAELLLVRALHYAGRVDDAIATAEASLESNPQQPALAAALATLYLDDERLEDAERLVSVARNRGHVLPELLCVSGYLALAKDDTATAAANFSDALKSRPRDGRSLLGAGLTRAAGGDLPQAIELLQHAAESMPNHLGTLNALAWMQLMAGQLDKASENLRRAQGVNDSFAETYGAQAVIAAMRGEDVTARNLIRTALKLDRNCFGAAYAEMVLRHGKDSSLTQDAALSFLSKQAAPAGGTMKDAVLRLAQRSNRASKRLN